MCGNDSLYSRRLDFGMLFYYFIFMDAHAHLFLIHHKNDYQGASSTSSRFHLIELKALA